MERCGEILVMHFPSWDRRPEYAAEQTATKSECYKVPETRSKEDKVLRSRLAFLLLAYLLLVPAWLISALDVPALRGRVNDLAGLLSRDEANGLEQRLAQFERETGHQIVVLALPSLEGEDPAAFALKTAETWKLGQKGHDNWALLLISLKDRKLRIEVGYGLEGTLPDAIASQIIRNVLVPRFREKDYAGGIASALNAMMQVTRGEPLPEMARRQPQNPQSNRYFQIGLVGMFALIGAMAFVSSMQRHRSGWSTRGRRYPPVGWGGPFGGGGFGGGGFGGGGFGGGGFSGGGGGGGGGGGASGSW